MTDKITPSVFRAMQADAEAALQAVAKKHGVSITLGSGNYDATSAVLKLQIATLSSDGEAQTREAKAFTERCHLYGLTADMLGRSFQSRGKTFTVTGLNPKGKTYPVLARDAEGKTYKFPADSVRLRLQSAA